MRSRGCLGVENYGRQDSFYTTVFAISEISVISEIFYIKINVRFIVFIVWGEFSTIF